jgi:hypothetical protein
VEFTYRSPDKTIWLGRADGLWRLVDGRLVRVDLPKEMADQSPFLQTITQDRRRGMWVTFGRHGLYRLADGVWTSYGGREDLPKTGVVIEFTDSLGRVWFGYTKSQLAVLDDDHVQVFGPNDGIRVGNITAIYGRGSEIWIGGEFGLQQFDHGRFHTFQATDSEYRIAGEALRNAFRHAQAHRVEVTIRYDEQQLTLRVRGDGKGIVPATLEAKARAGHYGLRGMRERARKIGAQLELWSRPQSGTEMELKIPAATAYQSQRAWGTSRRSSDIDTQA